MKLTPLMAGEICHPRISSHCDAPPPGPSTHRLRRHHLQLRAEVGATLTSLAFAACFSPLRVAASIRDRRRRHLDNHRPVACQKRGVPKTS